MIEASGHKDLLVADSQPFKGFDSPSAIVQVLASPFRCFERRQASTINSPNTPAGIQSAGWFCSFIPVAFASPQDTAKQHRDRSCLRARLVTPPVVTKKRPMSGFDLNRRGRFEDAVKRCCQKKKTLHNLKQARRRRTSDYGASQRTSSTACDTRVAAGPAEFTLTGTACARALNTLEDATMGSKQPFLTQPKNPSRTRELRVCSTRR